MGGRGGLLALFLLCLPAHADNAKPLPAIVRKYVAAIYNIKRVKISAVQTEPKGGPPDTAFLGIGGRWPTVLAVTSHYAGKSTTLEMDGRNVTQWNATQINTQPTPKTIAELSPALPMGAAASIALSLLTDATTITDYANLKDTGPATIDGQSAHKVVSVEDADTATFWIATRTGLPVQARFTGGRHNRTILIHYLPIPTVTRTGQKIIWALPEPPQGLTVYTPPAEVPLLAVGTPAPDFTLPRLSASGTGKSVVTLSALKGKVVLIDFWASWCRPCKKTMPHIQQLHSKAEDALTVISLNTWDTPARAAAFLKSHPQYTSQFVADFAPSGTGIAVSKYKVSGIPTVYIIDKDGLVAGAFVGDDPGAASQINAALSKLGISL